MKNEDNNAKKRGRIVYLGKRLSILMLCVCVPTISVAAKVSEVKEKQRNPNLFKLVLAEDKVDSTTNPVENNPFPNKEPMKPVEQEKIEPQNETIVEDTINHNKKPVDSTTIVAEKQVSPEKPIAEKTTEDTSPADSKKNIKKESKRGKNNKDKTKFEVSYYCSCKECTESEEAVTASGKKPKEGVTIAAPSDIPFGTKIQIDGLGTYTVQDRGGHIKRVTNENGEELVRVDIYLENHDECYNRGRHTAYGYIK